MKREKTQNPQSPEEGKPKQHRSRKVATSAVASGAGGEVNLDPHPSAAPLPKLTVASTEATSRARDKIEEEFAVDKSGRVFESKENEGSPGLVFVKLRDHLRGRIAKGESTYGAWTFKEQEYRRKKESDSKDPTPS